MSQSVLKTSRKGCALFLFFIKTECYKKKYCLNDRSGIVMKNSKINESLARIIFCSIIVLLLGVTDLKAQEKEWKKSALYVEIGGNGEVWSANYDRQFYEKNNFKVGYRFGISAFPSRDTDEVNWRLMIPAEAYGLWGRDKHFLELGIGASLVHGNRFKPSDEANGGDYQSVFEVAMFPRLGYRHQRKEGGFMYRIGFTPVVLDTGDKPSLKFAPWGGISLGKSF